VGRPGETIDRALPDEVAVAIIEFVYGALADNPQYRLDTDRRTVVIEALAHRSDIYRRR